MIKFNTKVGELTIIKQGSAHVSDDMKLNIIIDDSLKIEFKFEEDSDIKKGKITSVIKEDKLVLTLINQSNPLGAGILEPLGIGNLKGKPFYISFFVWTPEIKKDKRIINYIFYIKE